jgi:hypothetical protein
MIGSDLYAGGAFDQSGGQAANKIARWDGTNWYAVGNLTDTSQVADVRAIAGFDSGAGLYAGGGFSMHGVHFFAIWDGTQMDGTGSGNGVLGDVNAVAIQDNGSTIQVYIGGNFHYAGELPVNNIARWDGSNWNALGSGVNGIVTSIGIAGSNVYVGGSFTQAGGITANRIGRWNGSTWASLGTGRANGVNDVVSVITVNGHDIYVGGSFTQAGDITANRIARWNGTTWSAFISGFNNNGVNGTVYAIAVSLGKVYVGGNFSRAGGLLANNIAKWDGSGWSQLGNGLDDVVDAIATNDDGSHVYAGGIFKYSGNLMVNQIARWNTYTSSWSALAGGMTSHNSFYPYVSAITVSNSELVYVGGNFSKAGNVIVNNLALWDGSAWSTFGGTEGAAHVHQSAEVFSVAIRDLTHDTLYIGGSFSLAGGMPSVSFARRYWVPAP